MAFRSDACPEKEVSGKEVSGKELPDQNTSRNAEPQNNNSKKRVCDQDAIHGADQNPSKRMRFLEEETTTHIAQVELQHPQPRSVSSRHTAAFLHPVPGQNKGKTSLVSAWLESLDADQERRQSRSDSGLLLRKPNKPPVSRTLCSSAPTMSTKRTVDGFVVPPTPSSYSGLQNSTTPGTDVGSQASGTTSLVKQATYRPLNLAANRIFLRKPWEDLPGFANNLMVRISARRASPGPSVDTVRKDSVLMGLDEPFVTESRVESVFNSTIFAVPDNPVPLRTEKRLPMARRVVPNEGMGCNVSTPVPDLLFGYGTDGFPKHIQHLIALGNQPIATSTALMYPFFVVEYKSDDGSLWVAVNQCLGGAAACVNMLEQFHKKLVIAGCEGLRDEDRVAFSIAMNGADARVHMTWMAPSGDYFTQQVRAYQLQDPNHYIEFRRYSKNIIDWGKVHRLKAIQAGMDRLMQAGAFRGRGSSVSGSSVSSKKARR